MTTDSIDTAAPSQPRSIPDVVAGVRRTFAAGRTRPVEWRRAQLTALSKMMSENETRIAEALATDLGRKPFEAWLADVASVVAEADDAAKNVGKWTKRKHRLLERSQLPGRAWIEYEPYGTVLIIGAWNFPFALTLGPLVGALAAGNAVVLKPSELAPASSAMMAELAARYLDRDAIAVVEGDGAVSQELIAQGFDKLCFTGGTEIGRRVYEAAAPHLTPVTLELGGKSPVIVASDADVEVAAKRIAWTKLINSGQICIAPDYVLADKSVSDKLVAEIRKSIEHFRSQDTGGMRIVNERHFNRLTAAIAATTSSVCRGITSTAAVPARSNRARSCAYAATTSGSASGWTTPSRWATRPRPRCGCDEDAPRDRRPRRGMPGAPRGRTGHSVRVRPGRHAHHRWHVPGRHGRRLQQRRPPGPGDGGPHGEHGRGRPQHDRRRRKQLHGDARELPGGLRARCGDER